MINRQNDIRNQSGQGPFRPDQLWAITRDPMLRWADVSGGMTLIEQLMVNPNDPYLQEMLELQVNGQMEQAMASNDPFYPNYPSAGQLVPTAPFVILGRLPDLNFMFIPSDRLKLNIFIPGRTGSGKTTLTQLIAIQLVKLGYCVIVIDQKRSWRKLLHQSELRGKVIVLNYKDFRLTLFDPVDGETPAEAINWKTRVIGSTYGRYTSHRILPDIASSSVIIDELINRVLQFKPGRGHREAQYRESILWVLKDIKHHFGKVFNYKSSNFMDVLCKESRLNIIECYGLPTQPLSFFAGHIQTRYFRERLHNPAACQIPLVFILEDATAMADIQHDRETPGGVSLLSEMMFLSRELNIGTILLAHSLSSISPKILKNAESHIFLALPGEDPRAIQRILGTTPEQTAAIRILQPGQAVASNSSIWPLPVLIHFPPLPNIHVSDAECEATAREFLAGVTATKEEGISNIDLGNRHPETGHIDNTSRERGSHLDSEALRILILLAKPIPPSLTNLYNQVGISRARGVSIIKKLETRGLVKLHKFLTGKRGGQLTLLEITRIGWSVLSNHGIHQPKPVTKGSWEHNLGALAIGELHRHQRDSIDYELDLGGVRMDIRTRSKTGQITFYQICISSPEREVQSVIKAMKIPVVKTNRLVLVCRDKSFEKKVISLLQKVYPTGAFNKTITIRLVGDALAKVYR